MKTLSLDAFQRARRFIKEQARPVDRAQFEHSFEGAPADLVLSELAAYQNPDGGFGRALEPDLRAPDSSPLATRIGLRILQAVGAPAEHEMVQGVVSYLLKDLDPQTKTWRIVPRAAEAYPHAPWWNQENGALERTFGNFLVNPRAELVHLLYGYPGLAPAELLDELARLTVEAVEADDEIGTGGGDAVVQVLQLAQTPGLPEAYRERLIQRMQPVVTRSVNRSTKAWSTYVLTAVKVAPSPRSLAAAWLEDILPANLDYLIDSQAQDGAWDPTWTWFGQYPEVWEQACQEWRGEITLHTLKVLRNYERLA